MIRSRYTYVRLRGEEAFAAVSAALSPAARKVMEDGPLETQWYPYDVYIEMSEVIDRVLGEGDLALVQEMGSFSCEHNLTGIYRLFFRWGNLGFLVDRAAKAWHSQYDFGSMKSTRDPDNRNHVTLELTNCPRPTRALYLAVKGWVMTAAELSGSELVKAEDHYTDDPDQPMRWVFEYL